MKTTFKLIIGTIAVLIFVLESCKKDTAQCNYSSKVQNELDTLNTAFSVYHADSTNTEKCHAYQDAYQIYLDALISQSDCAADAGQTDILQHDIDQAQTAIDGIYCPCNWVTEVQSELDAVDAALSAYVDDPFNSAKCQAYKDALQNYLNALEDHKGCVPAEQSAQLQQSIDAAHSLLDGLQC
ncbi:MAG: hypothetical protein WBP41_17660 [Saprospiraceae bacterium]